MLQLRPLHTDIDSLSLSGFKLGLGCRDISLGHDTGIIAVLSKLQSFSVSFNRFLKIFLLGIQSP